jgi:tetratricopeptide (TPR) repeat protein
VDDFSIAVDLCDRALTQAPDDALVLAIAAMGFHNLRDDGEAGLASAERALALNPYSGPVLSIAATIQRQRRRADSAIALYERRLRLSPNSPYEVMGLEGIGCCHLDAGRYAEAVDWLRQSLALDASWDLTLVNLTVAHAMLGQLTEADEALRRLLAVRPGATIRGLIDRMAPGTRQSVERVWLEGLRRVGLPEG